MGGSRYSEEGEFWAAFVQDRASKVGGKLVERTASVNRKVERKAENFKKGFLRWAKINCNDPAFPFTINLGTRAASAR